MTSNLYNTASVLVPKGAAGRASVIDAYRPAFNVLQSIGITRNDANGSFRNQQGLIEFAAANVPRFNWDEGDSCPKLLVEPSRENKILYSEDFTVANWAKSDWGFTTGVTDLNGGSTAIRLTGDGVSPNNAFFQTFTGSTGVDYTGTFYIRRVSGSGNITIRVGDVAPTSDPLNLTSEWQRFSFTAQSSTTTVRLGIVGSANSTDVIEVCFAQIEEGSYATSYIKTEATTQTRNADVISQTGLASLIGDSEGTLYVEGEVFDVANASRITLSDGSNSNQVFFFLNSSTQLYQTNQGGSSQAQITSAVATNTNQVYKLAGAYSVNDFVFYVDGVQIGTDTSGSTYSDGTLDVLSFSQGDGTGDEFYGKISVLAWWQARLSNSVLESLTSYETYEEMAATLDYTID